MVIREILKKAADILKDKGIEDSFNEAAVLFAFASDKPKTYIFTHMDKSADENIIKRFDGFIIKRSRRMPVAYIVGSAWFMSLEFYVNESTLIPRPETEGLAEEVLRLAKDSNNKKISVLDLCTGSGCVGISIAYHNKKIAATLSDINPDCIKIARKNISKHRLNDRVSAIKSDLYQFLGNTKFDYIIANPPYIPSKDLNELDADVRLYEPTLALDGGEDGLDFYKLIISGAAEHLNSNGRIFLEAGIYQTDSIASILSNAGFKEISIKNDINGIPRILTAHI